MAKVIFEVNNLRNNNSIGRLVVSNNGRDKGNFYIVANIKEQYLYLVNGSTKTIEKPKKKKKKHVILTNVIDVNIKNSIESQDKNANLKIKRFIKLNGTVKEVWLPYVKRWYYRNGR